MATPPPYLSLSEVVGEVLHGISAYGGDVDVLPRVLLAQGIYSLLDVLRHLRGGGEEGRMGRYDVSRV